jgi:hypothetical protein
MVKPSSWLMPFLRLKGKPVKKKGRKVQLEKRKDDPTGRAGLKEDYGYQQLKDFELRVFLTLQQKVEGGR